MPRTKSPAKPKPKAKWRKWTVADQKANPKRKCSVAGCSELPVRARETTTPTGRTRTHAYCESHALENGG